MNDDSDRKTKKRNKREEPIDEDARPNDFDTEVDLLTQEIAQSLPSDTNMVQRANQMWKDNVIPAFNYCLEHKIITNGGLSMQIGAESAVDPIEAIRLVQLSYTTPDMDTTQLKDFQEHQQKSKPIRRVYTQIVDVSSRQLAQLGPIPVSSIQGKLFTALYLMAKPYQVLSLSVDVCTLIDDSAETPTIFILIAGSRRIADWTGRSGNIHLLQGMWDVQRMVGIKEAFEAITSLYDPKDTNVYKPYRLCFVGHSRGGWMAEIAGIELNCNFISVNGP